MDENMKIYIELGSKLRKLREQHGFSLEDVAKKINKTKKTVQRYETGESRIRINVVDDLCAIYGISREDLLSTKNEYRNIIELTNKNINLSVNGLLLNESMTEDLIKFANYLVSNKN